MTSRAKVERARTQHQLREQLTGEASAWTAAELRCPQCDHLVGLVYDTSTGPRLFAEKRRRRGPNRFNGWTERQLYTTMRITTVDTGEVRLVPPAEMVSFAVVCKEGIWRSAPEPLRAAVDEAIREHKTTTYSAFDGPRRV